MKRTYKTILIISGILVVGICTYKFGSSFAPGSYPYAEIYELNSSEQTVIKVIKEFKTAHPELVVPKVSIQNKGKFDLDDGRKDSTDLWYHFYFYDSVKNQIFNTWTRPEIISQTTFALVSINNGLNLGNWKDLNKDFSSSENEYFKQHFKDLVLDSIKQRLKHTIVPKH